MYYNFDKEFLQSIVIMELQERDYAKKSIYMDKQKEKEDEINARKAQEQTVQNRRVNRNQRKTPLR